MKILVLGGYWKNPHSENPDLTSGAPLMTVYELTHTLLQMKHEVKCLNGGKYSDLRKALDTCNQYDMVFWFVEADDMPALPLVKELAPYVMLVTGKWNPHNKYSFDKLNIMTLQQKANLTFELIGRYDKLNNVHVYDPLGCSWYRGEKFNDAVSAAMERLAYLKSITRRKTVPSNAPGLLLSWYFDAFKTPEEASDVTVEIPDESEFVELVSQYSNDFYRLMGVDESLSDVQAPQVGRCCKGMPSFKAGKFVFVSPRVEPHKHISLEEFVPCYMDDADEPVLHYCGENKPTVDAPIHMALYEKLPNIRYILHSHEYIKGAPFTTKAIPCGALEEVDEVINAIKKYYGSTNQTAYRLNLKGHGSLLMASTVDELRGVTYVSRGMPENMANDR